MRVLAAWVTVLSVGALVVSCAGASDGGGEKDEGEGNEGGAGGEAATSGVCADACPKPCDLDEECETQNGELCCDFGADVGKACTAAASCPRFCASDQECDTAQGEACLRTTVASPQTTCTKPENAIDTCAADTECGVGEKCCGMYGTPICVDADQCPTPCTVNEECNSPLGEICCPSFKLLDPSIAVNGLCVNPSVTPCPTPCSQSSECNSAGGELCCNGVCSDSCPKTCDSSDECTGQICCKTKAAQSVWLSDGIGPIFQVGTGDTCAYANNGNCDEPGLCPTGSDTTDCANSCYYAFDGYCDEGDLCAPGTDTADCGPDVDCEDLLQCACTGTCGSVCGNLCSGGSPDSTCMACAQSYCAPEYDACFGSG